MLGEILGHSDRIVVMRDGRTVVSDAACAFSRDRLVAEMGGEEETAHSVPASGFLRGTTR
ncbi:hypothetical protein D3C83_313590 [compost metagenome]